MRQRERPAPIDAGRLIQLVDDFEGRRVAVFGDLIVDEFIYGEIARVSREAPVLILNYDSTELVPGGAGNAASNVASLGGRPVVVGLAGQDDAGDRLVAALESNASRSGVRNAKPTGVRSGRTSAVRSGKVSGVARPRAYRTPTKTRILAGGVHSAKQQVVRIDRAAGPGAADAYRPAVAARFLRAATRCDAILVSDYGTGLVSPQLVSSAHKASGGVPLLVDSRYALLRYRGITACTPNESEVEQQLGVRIGDNLRVLERAGRELLTRTRALAVLITRGGRGMALFERDRPTVHILIHGSDQIADVTGAGDTVIAAMTLALAAGATFEEAARLANYAGGIVVMKRGTATVTADELRTAILTDIG